MKNQNAVVVAIEQQYSDNNGAYPVLCMYDTKEDFFFFESGMYQPDLECSVNPENDKRREPELVAKAASAYRRQLIDLAHRDGNDTLIGCIVTLSRSRKAPNKVELKVVDYMPRMWNNAYCRYDDAKVAVLVEHHEAPVQKVWVSRSCVDKVILGKAPFWAS